MEHSRKPPDGFPPNIGHAPTAEVATYHRQFGNWTGAFSRISAQWRRSSPHKLSLTRAQPFAVRENSSKLPAKNIFGPIDHGRNKSAATANRIEQIGLFDQDRFVVKALLISNQGCDDAQN
jgi:hypothetical protein